MSDFWGTLPDWIIAVSAGGAALVALKGLNTWRSQLNYQADHDLARRMLSAVYGQRQSLKSARWPFISAAEQEKENGRVVTYMDSDEERHAGLVRAHVRRWNQVASYEKEIQALLLEADAIWGAELRGLWNKLAELVRKLNIATQFELEASEPRHREGGYYASREDRVSARKHVYGQWEADDEFAKDFDLALGPLETYLRKKLGRTS